MTEGTAIAIGVRLFLAFLSVICFLVCLGFVGIYNVKNVMQTVEEANGRVLELKMIQGRLNHARIYIYDLVSPGDREQIDRIKARFNADMDSIAETLDTYGLPRDTFDAARATYNRIIRLTYGEADMHADKVLRTLSKIEHERLSVLFDEKVSAIIDTLQSRISQVYHRAILLTVVLCSMALITLTAWVFFLGCLLADRKHAEEMQHRYLERLDLLHRMDQSLLGVRSPDAVAQAALHHILHMVPCDRATIVTFDEEMGTGTLHAMYSRQETEIDVGLCLPLSSFYVSKGMTAGEPMVVADMAISTHDSDVARRLAMRGIRSCAGVPMMIEGRMIGAIYVGKERAGGFLTEHLDIVTEAANSLATVIYNAQLHAALMKSAGELEMRVERRTRELAAANRSLVAANRELEAFSYSVSHDLRAPLRRIDGFCQALEEDHEGSLNPEGVACLGRVRKASRHMAGLIDDILHLARVTRCEMTTEPLNLSSLVLSMHKDLERQHPRRSVALSVAPGVMCQGDPRLVHILVANLMGNAWKFTSRKERACLEFGVSGAREHGKPVYFFKDNGVGFDMKGQDKLFRPFQRLHSGDAFQGSGVGLATAQRIVHRHGGTIWAEGTPGVGAVFYFTL
ncbi:ATP-binding protein [Desulfoluna spongiiphila]|uniref:histidine kinase n=1 Tax=Desulfoluna spongiiphila TaxID=419481 RepID=A0A1G5F5N9_9BACT|nr:ATP-binding protein [Desulfoluna spongiiphila]SCY34545.1 Four helix bundle sensory module for signal transduction [Desulfoluna spongiiphila]